MNMEDLTKLGLEEEVAKKIIVLHGKGIESKKSDINSLDKKLEANKVKFERLEDQLKAANTTVQSLKDMDPEAAKKAAADWEAKAKEHEETIKQAQTDSDKAIKEMRFTHKLEAALTETGVKDPADVLHLLKQETISIGEDGKFVGLTEQLEPLRESKDYLFEASDGTPKITVKTNSQSVVQDSVFEAARAAAGLAVQTK